MPLDAVSNRADRIALACDNLQHAQQYPAHTLWHVEAAYYPLYQVGPLVEVMSIERIAFILACLQIGEEAAIQRLPGFTPEEIRTGFGALECMLLHKGAPGDRYADAQLECFRVAAQLFGLKLRDARLALHPAQRPLADQPALINSGRDHPVHRRIDLVLEKLERFVDGEASRQDLVAALTGILEIHSHNRQQVAKLQGGRALYLLGSARLRFRIKYDDNADHEFSCAAKIIEICTNGGRKIPVVEAKAARNNMMLFRDELSVASTTRPDAAATRQDTQHAD